jgi:NADH-quinone oxidoreductase subunit L
MFRMFFNTFHGECRASEEVKHHIHESPKVMTIPLMILAVLSIFGGYVGVPHLLGGSNHIEKWLEPVFGHHAPVAATHSAGGFGIVSTAFASTAEGHGAGGGVEMQLMIGAIIIGLLGIFIAWLFYVKKPDLPEKFVRKFQGLFTLVHNKYFVDELYGFVFVKGLFKVGKVCKNFVDETIIDGIINGMAGALSGIGGLIRKIQTGFVQGYAFGIIFGAIIVIGYLISRIL